MDLPWLWAAGALAVTVALALGLWWTARRRSGRIDAPEEAADAADAALGGFRTVGAVLGSDGLAALVVDASDRVAVCRRRGRRLAVDEVAWATIRATAAGLLVEAAGGAVLVARVDALDVRRMRAQAARNPASASPM